MPALENIKYEKFARHLFEGVPVRQAYEKAGYKWHNANAYRLRDDERIQGRVRELEEIAAHGAMIDKAYILSGLLNIYQKSSQAIPVLDKEGKPTGEYRYDSNGAVRALELLGKYLRMFGDGADANAAVTSLLQAVLTLLQAAPPDFRDYAVSELRKYQTGFGEQVSSGRA